MASTTWRSKFLLEKDLQRGAGIASGPNPPSSTQAVSRLVLHRPLGVTTDDGRYSAYVPALPPCISEGDALDDARRRIREAIDLYLPRSKTMNGLETGSRLGRGLTGRTRRPNSQRPKPDGFIAARRSSWRRAGACGICREVGRGVPNAGRLPRQTRPRRRRGRGGRERAGGCPSPRTRRRRSRRYQQGHQGRCPGYYPRATLGP